MVIVLICITVIALGIAIYYKNVYEANCEDFLDLEERLDEAININSQLKEMVRDAEIRSEEKLKRELKSQIIEGQHYNSVPNLINKIKTILD